MDRDPVRLIEDELADPRLRDALGRTAHTLARGPDVTPGLAKLQARIALGLRPPRKGFLSWVSGGIACLVGAIALYASMSRAPAKPRVPANPNAVAVEPSPTAASIEPPANTIAEAAPPEAPAPPPARSTPPPRRAERERPSDADEIAHLAELRAQARVDPSAALKLAEEGNRRFPHGRLHQEREALAIEALAKLGRTDEARARADRFFATYPKSAFNDRLRALISH